MYTFRREDGVCRADGRWHLASTLPLTPQAVLAKRVSARARRVRVVFVCATSLKTAACDRLVARHPAHCSQHNIDTKERTESDLVVAGEPEGEVAVEVVAAVVGEARRDIGEWTSQAIRDQDDHLHTDHANEHECR